MQQADSDTVGLLLLLVVALHPVEALVGVLQTSDVKNLPGYFLNYI